METKVTVIIANYNSKDILRKSIQNLVDQKIEYMRIIVVDNNSPDGSADMVASEFKDSVHQRNLDHLTIWHNIGRDVDNGIWAIAGSRMGTYMTMLTNWDHKNVQDFDQLLEWENGIHEEYKAYGEAYKEGRLKFLESLLDKYPHNTENLLKLVDWVKTNY